MLEVDRGTESLPTVVAKADRYLSYATTHPESPQVVLSLHSPHRAGRLAEALNNHRRPRQLTRLADELIVITTPDAAAAVLAGQEPPQ
jgi:hypothetical protein